MLRLLSSAGDGLNGFPQHKQYRTEFHPFLSGLSSTHFFNRFTPHYEEGLGCMGRIGGSVCRDVARRDRKFFVTMLPIARANDERATQTSG
jgi:hypothetical protein